MKTIYTLSTIALIALSLNSLADDKIKTKERSSAVSVAPFSWGDPEAEAPTGLSHIFIGNYSIPLAPFTWGSPEDKVSIIENKNLSVPVAPLVIGDPDDEAPVGLELIKAINLNVPVAPFLWGDAESDAPAGI